MLSNITITFTSGVGKPGQPHSSEIFHLAHTVCKCLNIMFNESPAKICVNISPATSCSLLSVHIIHLNASFSCSINVRLLTLLTEFVKRFGNFEIFSRRSCNRHHDNNVIIWLVTTKKNNDLCNYLWRSCVIYKYIQIPTCFR